MYAKIAWAQERVLHWWTELNFVHELDTIICPAPRIEFSDKMTVTAGMAYSRRNIIKLSTHFLMNEAAEAYDQTIGHELAHIFADKFYNQRCTHGYLWQKTMRKIGLPPDRCHTYESTQRRRRDDTIIFSCVCGASLKVGGIVQKRIKQGRKYHCVKCGTTMQLPQSDNFSKLALTLLENGV